jgi:transposase
MKVVYERCAGLDVHKKSVVACRIVPDEAGGWTSETRTFGTMLSDLLVLHDWLAQAAISHVAMESTGVYWRPIFNILEANFEVLLVNAKHIKFVPGRKTDVKDAQWIAQLLQHGLLQASFVPKVEQRELRELVRYRTHLIQERTREINRVHKVLEDANIKLTSVATDVMGVSGRQMLTALIEGQTDPETLAQLAKGRMRSKIEQLEQALTGHVKAHHRLLLTLHLKHIDDLNAMLEQLEAEIEQLMPPFDQHDLVTRLTTIPGVDRKVAQIIMAELGTDMSRFGSANHAASWAGLVPGKHESAGRNYSSRTQKANRYLRSALIQAAHAVGRSKDNYLSAQYRRLSARRGKKRAAVAVAHSILVIAYHIMQRGTQYIELGGNYFDQRKHDAVQKKLIARLEKLGLKVTVEPHSHAA